MEFRDVLLQELWRDTHHGQPVPTEVDRLRSWECLLGSRTVGHCTGDSKTGEIVSLAVTAEQQGLGIGRKLLSLLVDAIRASRVDRIWVVAPSDPTLRAYGFYRIIGWVPTGERTNDGSEIFELPADEMPRRRVAKTP